jgi:uncharacterized membrane protein YhaH (DUF805 family)
LICLVPLIGLVLIYFLVIAGDAGDNDYGPDPYGDGGGTIRPA